MPELPEIETISRQLQTITNNVITNISYNKNIKLRLPLDNSLDQILFQTIIKISRRAKYLIIQLTNGYLIIHLGMSGKLLLQVTSSAINRKHDHIVINLSNNHSLYYNDPRRFGCVIYRNNLDCLKHLALEPFDHNLNAQYLLQKLANKTTNIKTSILNGNIIVGVGNIYISEALYKAKIHPLRTANSLNLLECQQLLIAIKQVLLLAINHGGSSFQDFLNIKGQKGQATHYLSVYNNNGHNCSHCGQLITSIRIQNRNTFFCSNCQKL